MKKEQGGELQRKKVEAAARLAELSIENTRSMLTLMAELARTLCLETRINAGALAAAADPQELISQRTEHAQRTMRLMMAGARKVAAIDNEARAQFSRLLTEQLASGNQDLMDAFQAYFRVLPAQNNDVVEAIELAVARSHSALGQVAAVAAAARDDAKDDARTAARRPRAAGQCRRPVAGIASSHSAEPRAF